MADYRVTPAGINDDISNSFHVWPNPATKVITIDFTSGTDLEFIRIYDQRGMNVLSIPCAAGDKSWSSDVSALPPGLYLVVATGVRGQQFSSRFVRQ